jgi:hypothetical protein
MYKLLDYRANVPLAKWTWDNDIAQVQTLLVELVAASQASLGRSEAVVRSYLALTRACARVLERMVRRQEHAAGVSQIVLQHLDRVLEGTARTAQEWAAWRELFETGQYQVLLNELEKKWFGKVRGTKHPGMGHLTRTLAARALRLR